MIINCSHCSGPLAKDVSFEASSTATFEMKIKCPHCQHPATVKIQATLTPVVLVNNRMIEKLGDTGTATIRTLQS